MFLVPPKIHLQSLSVSRDLRLTAAIGMKLLLLLLSSLSILSGFSEGQEAGKEEDGKAGRIAQKRQLSVASSLDWSTAFSLQDEHKLARDSLLTTLPKMTKEWKVSLEVNPTDYSFGGYASVLHMSIGGKGVGSSAKEGDRIPAIWIHKTRGVVVSTSINGRAAYTKTFKTLPPAGEWTKIEVSQSLIGSEYIYSITIADENVFTMQNTKPVELSNVKVFAGSPWYTARKGSLRNLEIEIKDPSLGGCVKAGKTQLQYQLRNNHSAMISLRRVIRSS